MAKNPAARQAAYRQKHLHDLDGTKARLNLILDQRAKLALARLARHHGLTQTALLEKLLSEAQNQALAGMTAEEASAYYDAVTA
jgi:hypothetical protein